VSGTGLLRAVELSVRFGSTDALVDVSVDIVAGEFVAVVGASGSGKSTLLQCLAGILRPTAGGVFAEGERMDRWSDRVRSEWRLTNVGLVFQFGDLLPELSLVDNVRLPLLLAGSDKQTAGRRAHDVIDRLGISDVADRRPGQVSGGQLQRAAVARALVHSPAVVLADEPTGALDTTTGQLVLEALLDAAREQGSAVVLVTHEARLSSYCDREIVLQDGSIVMPVAS
jgi:putative ABC transport system ATP-binding protein